MLPQNNFVFEHFASGGAVDFVQVLPTSTFPFLFTFLQRELESLLVNNYIFL